jgi:hypothetical protein
VGLLKIRRDYLLQDLILLISILSMLIDVNRKQSERIPFLANALMQTFYGYKARFKKA